MNEELKAQIQLLFKQALAQETLHFNMQDFHGRNFFGGQANAYKNCLVLLEKAEQK